MIVWQEYVDVASLMVRAKPYHDNEDLLIMCYRCSTYNPLSVNTTANSCTNCHQHFVFSFVTFGELAAYYLVIRQQYKTHRSDIVYPFYKMPNHFITNNRVCDQHYVIAEHDCKDFHDIINIITMSIAMNHLIFKFI